MYRAVLEFVLGFVAVAEPNAPANATVGIGLGANVLIGGSSNSIALQPLSIEGNTGLDVAAGIAAMSLTCQLLAILPDPSPFGAPPKARSSDATAMAA